MRVIHVVPAVSREASGPSYSVMRLSQSLLSEGKDVVLTSLRLSTGTDSPVFLKEFPLGLGPKRLGRSPSMRRWLELEALSGRVALYHNHGMWQMNSIYPGYIAKRYGLPYIISPRGAFSKVAFNHGSSLKKLFWKIWQKPSFESVSLIHSTSTSEYLDVRRMGFMQPVAVIPNGIDIPSFAQKLERPERILLFLGRIHPIKGLDMLLPAWKAVQNRFPEWKLRLVGTDIGYVSPGGYLDEMRRLSNKLGLIRVEFSGPLYGSSKWNAFSKSDLTVLPTYSENFGMSVAESLASGTPAIVTKGAPWQGLENHNAGKWIEIGIDPLICAMEELMSKSPQELRQMGLRGRQWMLRDFSWKKIGHDMAEVYDWVCGKSTITPSMVRMD